MKKTPWKSFLSKWSVELISSQLAAVFPPENQESGWVGSPGASEADLIQAENRLKTRLPPSYRSFLSTSNGWLMLAPELCRMYSTKEISWLIECSASMVEDWSLGVELSGSADSVKDEEYFVYGDRQDPVYFRPEYLRSCLQISDIDTRNGSVYLLNPQVVDPDGEWEAWCLASYFPGAIRYRSFWELMQAEHDRFSDLLRDALPWTAEFISYAQERLQPVDGEFSKDKLVEIIQALEEELERMLTIQESKPGAPTRLPRYQQSAAASIRSAIDSVRTIQENTQDPREIRQQLEILADDLERRGRQGFKATMSKLDNNEMIRASLHYKISGEIDALDQQLQPGGESVGFYTAARIIRAVPGQESR